MNANLARKSLTIKLNPLIINVLRLHQQALVNPDQNHVNKTHQILIEKLAAHATSTLQMDVVRRGHIPLVSPKPPA
jgi:hypothetical protein